MSHKLYAECSASLHSYTLMASYSRWILDLKRIYLFVGIEAAFGVMGQLLHVEIFVKVLVHSLVLDRDPVRL